MRLSPDSVDAQIGLQSVFCHSRHTTTRPVQRTAHRSVHRPPPSLSWSAVTEEFCTATWGRDDGSPFLMLVTDACIVTTATRADRLVMSGHTDPIRSLANNSADSLICLHVSKAAPRLKVQIHQNIKNKRGRKGSRCWIFCDHLSSFCCLNKTSTLWEVRKK